MTLHFWEGIENKKEYIRSYGEGVGVPSRNWLLTLVKDGESLLDIGCGPGIEYENLKTHNRDVGYRGYDLSPGFVEACKELFPEGDFRVGDAMNVPEPDDSFDTVLLRHVVEHTENYEVPINEAIRVAKRRVVIILWRPLSQHPDKIHVHKDGSNDYNKAKFLSFLNSFNFPVQYEEFDHGNGRMNWGFVIYKVQDRCVFDLDDFHTDAPNVSLLFQLKSKYPKLKVNLFTIPAMCDFKRLREYAEMDWIELAVHGWTHQPNAEVEEWSLRQAHYYLRKAEKTGCFVKGFKAPGWRINREVVLALRRRGYWLAHHADYPKVVSGFKLPIYYVHGNGMAVHGHMQNINSGRPELRNGLPQLMEERGLPWDKDTEFSFISEVV